MAFCVWAVSFASHRILALPKIQLYEIRTRYVLKHLFYIVFFVFVRLAGLR